MGVIMVVDDELDVLETVRRGLEKWGYHVDTFSNPHAALQTFTGSPSRYSLILTDFRMPGMTGIELAKLVHQTKNDVKVLIMTAFELDQEMLRDIPTIDKTEILQKPFRLEQLCKAVKKSLTVHKRTRE